MNISHEIIIIFYMGLVFGLSLIYISLLVYIGVDEWKERYGKFTPYDGNSELVNFTMEYLPTKRR